MGKFLKHFFFFKGQFCAVKIGWSVRSVGNVAPTTSNQFFGTPKSSFWKKAQKNSGGWTRLNGTLAER